jgi:N utilization substance protein B
MLNRRILRVKAMQALYSYYTTRESLKDVIREQLEKKFYPDPAKDDFTLADEFTARRKLASQLYLQYLQNRQVGDTDKADDEIIKEVNLAIAKYHSELQKEVKSIRNLMTGDVDEIYKLYLKLLSLPIELAHVEKQDKDKRDKAYIKKSTHWNWHLINSPVVDDLTKYEAFTKELINQKISWADELDQLRTWYKEIIRKDEEIQTYQSNLNPTLDDHKNILLYFFKKIIFKNESVNEYLSESDLHWSENRNILKSLVVKTFQDYEPDLDPPFELKEVSKNGTDDLEFFEVLFDETLKKDLELDELIVNKVKNWDISRVALTDRIILKMAITEMTNFHSIPVKVTINEFIEVSKNYSTPKSKQFVNGILDVLANELTSDGVIRKSGRGLIDNK